MIERTLVLLKPDAVQRSLTGEIISRFERAGLKIVGMKLIQIEKDFAARHYTEDIAVRKGEQVRSWLIDYIVEGPVLAIVLEGVEAIEFVRKLGGPTDPKSAMPGTIRGDFAHVSYSHADKLKIPIRNLIHASGNKEDAEREIKLWFSESELFNYKTVHEHLTQ